MRFRRVKKRDPERRSVSNCGRYEVWVQARYLNGEVEWVSRLTPSGSDQMIPWLCVAGTYREAVEACKIFEKQRRVDTLE